MLKIRLICFRENTGYGNASRSLINALTEFKKVTVDWIEILPGNTVCGGKYLSDLTSHQCEVDHVIIHTVPEYYPFWYKREKALNPQVKVWGYTAWETDCIPDHWTGLINQLDGVFVPCNWNKDIFKSSGITIPVKVLPHISEFHGRTAGVGETLTLPGLPRIKDEQHFVFYTIGVWNERKNNQALVKAFLEEFSVHENVSLIIKSGATDWTQYRRKWYKGFRRDFGDATQAFTALTRKRKNHNICHLTADFTSSEIASLHHYCDCFISLTRGEGWGMGAYEAAWFGNPVAITGLGGAMDFLSDDDAYWINYKAVPVKTAYGRASYSPNQNWAEIEEVSARETMRHIFEHQEAAALRGGRLKNHVINNYSDSTVINNFLRILNE